MRAMIFHKFGGPITVQEVEDPIPGENDAVIKVEATGLCRSDWHGWKGHDSDISLPHVPGHEFAGTISSKGSAVQLPIGMRVVAPFVQGCSKCEFCQSGNAQVCPTQTQAGFTHFGSFAEYVLVKSADFNLVPLPESIAFDVAASLGCRFATSYRALIDRAKIAPEEVVAVFGCGGVGLSAVMIAASRGAHVIAIDINSASLQKAETVGAKTLVNSSKEKTPLESVDVAIDALGSPETASAAILSLKRRGRMVQVGLLPTNPELPISRIISHEIDLLGSHGMSALHYPRMLKQIEAGVLKPELLLDDALSLDQAAVELSKLGEQPSRGGRIIHPNSR